MGRIGATLSGIERTLLNRLAEANTAAALNSLRLASQKKSACKSALARMMSIAPIRWAREIHQVPRRFHNRKLSRA